MNSEPGAPTNLPDWERLRTELVAREWITHHLEQWLGTDERVFLITGPPGTGKTWYAAQLALQSTRPHPIIDDFPRLLASTLVLSHFCDAADARTLDPGDFVAKLSQALAQRVPGFSEAVAESVADSRMQISINAIQNVGSIESGASATNVAIHFSRDVPSRRLFAALVRRPLEAVVADGWNGRAVVVVDDLSSGYQYDAEDNIARLIGDVATNCAESPDGLRFVLTSRSDPWVLSGLPPPALDLHDDSPDQTDITAYIHHRLPAVGEPLQTRWAELLALVADGNFLFARHTLDDVAHRLETGSRDSAEYQFPTGLADLYRRWFSSTLARSRERWWGWQQPVLSALTVSRAAGFTPTQLAGITGLPMSKVRYALEECAQFLLHNTNTAQIRIYHESFREFLAAEHMQIDEAHRAVLDYFVRQHDNGWLECDNYCRIHLVDHAAAIGEVGALATRADFLVAVEPMALLRELDDLPREHKHGEVFARAGWLLTDLDPGERASQLELAAYEIGAVEIAAELESLPLPRAWQPKWSALVRHTPSTYIGAHPRGALDLLPLGRHRADVVATFGNDDRLRLWDLSARQTLTELLLPATGPPGQLALVSISNTDYLMVTGSRQVWLVDLDRFEAVASIPTRPGILLTTSTTMVLDHGEAVVFGYADGVVQVVDPYNGNLLAEPWQAHDGPVFAVTSQSPFLLISTGADGKVAIRYVGVGADDLESFSGTLLTPQAPCWSRAVKTATVNDTDSVLAVGHSDGHVHLMIFGDRPGVVVTSNHAPASWGYQYRTFLVLTDGGYAFADGYGQGSNDFRDVMRAYRSEENTDPSQGIAALFGGVNCVDLTVADDLIHAVTAGEDGKIVYHVTDMNFDAVTDTVLAGGQPVGVVTFAEVNQRRVLLSAESSHSGAIRLWPLTTSSSPLPPTIGELSAPIRHFDCIADSFGMLVIAIVKQDETIDLYYGNENWSFDTAGLSIHEVRLWHANGSLWTAALGSRNGSGAIRLWQFRSKADPIVVHNLYFEYFIRIFGVTSLQSDAGFLVAGTEHDGCPALAIIRQEVDCWTANPVQVDDISSEGGQIDWMIPVVGTGGREVFVGGVGTVHHISIDNGRLATDPLFAAQHPAAIRSDHGAAIASERLSSVYIKTLERDGAGVSLFIKPHADVLSVAVFDDGAIVVAGTADGRIIIWHDIRLEPPTHVVHSPGTTDYKVVERASGKEPNQIIRLPAAVLQLVVPSAEIIVARTDFGVYTLQIHGPT